MMNDFDSINKISIVPRGETGGVTIFSPNEEAMNSGLYSKEYLENKICVGLGGRIAEELINGKNKITSGASNDIDQVTRTAKSMVMNMGMSEKIGLRSMESMV
jgi:cell division protease FtsH